jgi:signal transduction histidine kinase/PAS domain-containing protein
MAASLGLLAIVSGGIISALISVGLAGVSWQHRDVPAALPFGLLSLAIAAWALFDASTHLTRDPEVALSLYRLAGVVAVQIPPIWVVFAYVYAGKRQRLTTGRIALLWLFPLAYVALTLTASYHSLMPDSVVFVTANGITAPVVEKSVGFWATEVVAIGYILFGYGILGEQLSSSRTLYRKQTTLIIMGSLVPFLANAFFVAGVRVHPGIDLTTIAFTVNGIVIGWALFEYDFLSVTPLANDVLVDELPDPVLVLDSENHVVDCNPAVADLTDGDDPSGSHVDAVLPGILDHLASGDEVTLSGPDGDTRVYDPLVTPIRDQHGTGHGRLLVLRDVSVQHRRLDRLEALQAATQQFIQAKSERQVARAATDFAERVLDQDLAVVFAHDDETGRLVPAAMTESVAQTVEAAALQTSAADGGPLWSAFEEGEMVVYDGIDEPLDCPLDALSPSKVLLVPLGPHGLFCIATTGPTNEYTDEDQQFAQILARTTETALARVARERQLRESRETVRRRTEQIEFFNGVLRHNIRNGMLVIDGNVDYLREFVDEPHHSNLDTISDWCDDLSELTEKIRSFTETVTADESERLTEVDLSETVTDGVEAIEHLHDDVRVDINVGDGLVVEANELLSEVVDSILRNAVEHNDASEPSIHVETVASNGWVQLRVSDNGPGISDELKESVFERSVATSQTAHGFGLYFVSVMMDLYGGTVWFEDNDPQGAVAVLEFELASSGQREADSYEELDGPT